MVLKQFKKWENAKGRCEIPDSICDQIQDCTACKFLQERGWKAALEWIYYAGVLTDWPADLIREELGDG